MLSSCKQETLTGVQTQTAGQGQDERNPLLGKPAPAFATVNPEGKTVDLSNYLGKDVILLDFWATWCGPCILAMPEVAGVAKEFKDRGLVFYAVNVGEDPDTVKEFLKKNKFDIPVAMDFERKIQDAFNAHGLPHTIIVGKDGRVQVDHIGYWRGFRKELAEQVDALLKGENLAE
jgi:thiol-disulfide isomerase/thioredoxin